MKYRLVVRGKYTRELFFHILLHIVVFFLYAFSKRHPQLEIAEAVFFLNYALMALIVNFFLLPRFLYPKKYLLFFTCFFLLLGLCTFVEEGILEPAYYPDTRGSNYLLLHSMLGILSRVAILSGCKLAWDALSKQREVEQLRHAVKESELQFLKSQINPHFLFNNMNNLYAHAIENSPKTPDIILELSSVLRYMLYECRATYVPVYKELEQLQNFINLYQLQIEGRGKVHYTVQDDSSGYQIAPLILMVFVENAFKHSSSSQTEGIDIEILLVIQANGSMHFSCINSFLTQSNTQRLSKGIGLENVQKRLQLLYPQAHTLYIAPQEGNYRVSLTMELNKITL